jgi:hypothetical protein
MSSSASSCGAPTPSKPSPATSTTSRTKVGPRPRSSSLSRHPMDLYHRDFPDWRSLKAAKDKALLKAMCAISMPPPSSPTPPLHGRACQGGARLRPCPPWSSLPRGARPRTRPRRTPPQRRTNLRRRSHAQPCPPPRVSARHWTTCSFSPSRHQRRRGVHGRERRRTRHQECLGRGGQGDGATRP